MGRRGPAKKPTAIKKLEGNPGKRKLPEAEPEFDAENVECPDFLNEEAKKEWGRVAPSLKLNGLLTEGDRAALAAYCIAWADFVDADEQLQRFGSVVKQGQQVIPSPYVSIKNKAAQLMLRVAKEFGFTPSARADLGTLRPDRPKTEFERKRLEKLYGPR